MNERNYYEAYDLRYRTVHAAGQNWFGGEATALVMDVMRRYGISRTDPVLELGCGEGRDAAVLLQGGFDLLATDVSPEAISWCRSCFPDQAERFQVLDCVKGALGKKYRFIYAVALVHMLVPDEDRAAFYRFVRDHLEKDGLALICSMGDGETEYQSDIRTAFDAQERSLRGKTVQVAGTSCRMVSFPVFEQEMESAGLTILDKGFTDVPEEFSSLMYAVVTGKE